VVYITENNVPKNEENEKQLTATKREETRKKKICL